MPDLRPQPAGAPVRCALDRHLGPFQPLPELRAWLGAEWFQCKTCRSTITRATASAARIAA